MHHNASHIHKRITHTSNASLKCECITNTRIHHSGHQRARARPARATSTSRPFPKSIALRTFPAPSPTISVREKSVSESVTYQIGYRLMSHIHTSQLSHVTRRMGHGVTSHFLMRQGHCYTGIASQRVAARECGMGWL